VRRPFSIAVLLTVVLSARPAAADPRVHVVAAGDTLSALAERYRVSVTQLRSWNALDDDTIRVGQQLTVEDEPTIRYRTRPGDTLGCIAQRHRVPLSRLRDDNPQLGRRLEVGVTLRIRGGVDPRAGEDSGDAPIAYEVRRGDTLTAIAARQDVTLAELRALNPDLDPDRLRVGAQIVVGRGGPSESVGHPWCGHIAGARQLAEHPGYVLRNPARSWATDATIRRLRRGFDVLRRRHPSGPRPRVHDLSLEGGGPIDDHRSHQSGRDVDITYLRREGCSAREGCPLESIDPEQMDVRRQWTLLHAWLRRDDAEAIYVDYGLQRALYREARRRGASRAQLRQWFQFPRGRRDADGVIRHFPNHRDHLHVRFACTRGEQRCE